MDLEINYIRLVILYLSFHTFFHFFLFFASLSCIACRPRLDMQCSLQFDRASSRVTPSRKPNSTWGTPPLLTRTFTGTLNFILLLVIKMRPSRLQTFSEECEEGFQGARSFQHQVPVACQRLPWHDQQRDCEKLSAWWQFYYRVKLARTYRACSTVSFRVAINAHHKGFFRFHICNMEHCPHNNITLNCIIVGTAASSSVFPSPNIRPDTRTTALWSIPTKTVASTSGVKTRSAEDTTAFTDLTERLNARFPLPLSATVACCISSERRPTTASQRASSTTSRTARLLKVEVSACASSKIAIATLEKFNLLRKTNSLRKTILFFSTQGPFRWLRRDGTVGETARGQFYRTISYNRHYLLKDTSPREIISFVWCG